MRLATVAPLTFILLAQHISLALGFMMFPPVALRPLQRSSASTKATERDEYDDWYADFDPSKFGVPDQQQRTPSRSAPSSSSSSRSSYSKGGRRGGSGHDYERDVRVDNSKVDLETVNSLIAERLQARKTGRFENADSIRDELLRSHGVKVDDKELQWRSGCSASGSGARWGGGRREQQSRGNQRGAAGGRRGKSFGPNGHDYNLSPDAGDNISDLSEPEIHRLLAQRLEYKLNRDYSRSDAIQEELFAAGVSVHDGRKEWRADGEAFGDFPSNSARPGRERNSRNDRNRPYEMSPQSQPTDDTTTIQDLVDERARAKRDRNFQLADANRDELRLEYNVEIDDRLRQWSVGGNFGYPPKAQGPFTQSQTSKMVENFDRIRPYEMSPQSLPTDATTTIQDLVDERARAKRDRNFQVADANRDELRLEYNVEIDDRLRQWSVGGNFGFPPKAQGPFTQSQTSKMVENAEEIQQLVEDRDQARTDRDFQTADSIREELLGRNIHIDDRSRQWAVGGNFVGKSSSSSEGYCQRGGGGNLSEEDEAIIMELVQERDGYKRDKLFGKADRIRDRLQEEFQVRVDDRSKEWHVVTNEYSLSTGSAPLDDATRKYVEEQVAKRAVAKLQRDYETADAIRDELMDDYSVSIDDRVKEWTVLGPETSEYAEDGVDDIYADDVDVDAGEGWEIENSEKESGGAELEASNSSDEDDLSSLTVPKLRERLREAGLPVSGNKAELIERLS